MNPALVSTHPARRMKRGFVLVIALTLMILLTILALGLLTLSGVSLRGSSHVLALTYAKANARMALQLAIGELQRQTGADTRVTARADIQSPTHPFVLGAWKSWQGDDHLKSGANAGRPIAPNGGNYPTAKKSRFLAWLTSANQLDPATLPDTRPATGKITLLGEGSVGKSRGKASAEIHLPPTPIKNPRQQGALAWWIGGENQKARLPNPYRPDDESPVQWADHTKVHNVSNPEIFGMQKLLTDASPADKAITLQQANLVSASTQTSRKYFHDLSAVSVGLLTNTATGGWRKDMSLFSESWTSQPRTHLPLFRLSADKGARSETSAGLATSSSVYETGSLFYPWSWYNTSDWLRQPVCSWNNLMDFVTFYKRANTDEDNYLNTSSAGYRKATAWAWNTDLGNHNPRYLHKVRLFPVVARIQWVFSHFAEVAGNDPADPNKKLYTPKLLMTPVVTMWNPYNLELTVPHNMYFEFKVIPVALSYQVGGQANSAYHCVLHTNGYTAPLSNTPALLEGSNPGTYNTCGFPAGLTLKPGETKVLSPAANDRKVPNGDGGPWGTSHTLELLPGYRASGGHLYPVKNTNGEVTAKPSATRLKAHVSFDTEYYMHWGTTGVGTYFEIRTKDPERYVEWMRTGYSVAVARALHPPITGNNAMEIQDLSQLVDNPQPFLSTLFGPRIATRVYNTVNPQFPPKGLVQSSPFAHFPHATYRRPNQSPSDYYPYAGTGHPINFGFEFSYVTHTSGGDDNTPNSGPNDTGFIISGVQSGNGVPRCILAELPARPLASLGELAGWDLRFENPVPPFAFNLVGNSDATPLVASNAVVNPSEQNIDASKPPNMRHDDSYCANHLLFDDWFFSGIAPNPATFGGNTPNQKSVYTDFLGGKHPLANHAYKPLLEDRSAVAADPAQADKLYDQFVNPAKHITAYRTIASRLEVEGMFNVNSTSVDAWRALLGHARNQRIPYYGAGANIELSDDADHITSRFIIAGDVQAGKPSAAGGFPEASEYTGYRLLNDAFIDELAAKIVAQVRKRGPFLSLAEFINRQLSTDKDLAAAGALQAALNELTQSSGAANPLAVIQQSARPTVANPPEGAGAEDKTGYVFATACAGHDCYGVPGWTRQADILKPLAPILSARDDTFLIRAYGDARDANDHILARCVCEAVVRRSRDFIDPNDLPDGTNPPAQSINQKFGRRYHLVSFRWLGANEV